MTTADKVLSVLALFTLERPEWTVEEAATELQLPISTAYRYFRSLSVAGLIVGFTLGRYVLGPAVTQFDRQMRLHDPLITKAQPVMKRLARLAPDHGVVLLCRLYRDQVMCVHQESVERPDFAISYERGRPMPLGHDPERREPRLRDSRVGKPPPHRHLVRHQVRDLGTDEEQQSNLAAEIGITLVSSVVFTK